MDGNKGYKNQEMIAKTQHLDRETFSPHQYQTDCMLSS